MGVLDALQGKAYQLYGSLHAVEHELLSTAEADMENHTLSKWAAEKVLESIDNR